MDKQLSLKKVIANDYLSFISVIFPVVLGVFLVFFFFSRNESLTTPGMLIAYGAIFLVSLICLIWRLSYMTHLVNEGIQAQAEIHSAVFFRDRGTIQFSYIFRDQKYLSKNFVMKNKNTDFYRSGQLDTVFVDQNNPKRAILGDLFIKDTH
jgi:hypothetical protein